jgi:hypothetical protein
MTDPVADAFHRQLDLVEHDVIGLAEAMPAEKYVFQPRDGAFEGVRSFGEQVRHLATVVYVTAAILLQEKSPYGPGPGDNGPVSVEGKEQMVAYLKGSLAYARTAVDSLSQQNHLDPLKTYFGAQPRIEVAAGLIYHSYNHYGQMVVYARMNGVVPPSTAQNAEAAARNPNRR